MGGGRDNNVLWPIIRAPTTQIERNFVRDVTTRLGDFPGEKDVVGLGRE